jgi:hypothetical protein
MFTLLFWLPQVNTKKTVRPGQNELNALIVFFSESKFQQSRGSSSPLLLLEQLCVLVPGWVTVRVLLLIDWSRSGISLTLGTNAAVKTSGMGSDSKMHASHHPALV